MTKQVIVPHIIQIQLANGLLRQTYFYRQYLTIIFILVFQDADFGSSSSYDILQPTQAYGTSETERKIENDHLNKEKKTILLETPQRDPATLIFAEASDENIPTEPGTCSYKSPAMKSQTFPQINQLSKTSLLTWCIPTSE